MGNQKKIPKQTPEALGKHMGKEFSAAADDFSLDTLERLETDMGTIGELIKKRFDWELKNIKQHIRGEMTKFLEEMGIMAKRKKNIPEQSSTNTQVPAQTDTDRASNTPQTPESPPSETPSTPISAKEKSSGFPCFTRTDYKNAKYVVENGMHSSIFDENRRSKGVLNKPERKEAVISMLYNKADYAQDLLKMGITGIDFELIPWEQKDKGLLMAVLQRARSLYNKKERPKKGFFKRIFTRDHIPEKYIQQAWSEIERHIDSKLSDDIQSKQFNQDWYDLETHPPQPESEEKAEKMGFFKKTWEALKGNELAVAAGVGGATTFADDIWRGVAGWRARSIAKKQTSNVIPFSKKRKISGGNPAVDSLRDAA